MPRLKNFSGFPYFDEDTQLLILDWLAANYGGDVGALICEAVAQHIHMRYDNEPEMRKRFDAARAKSRNSQCDLPDARTHAGLAPR